MRSIGPGGMSGPSEALMVTVGEGTCTRGAERPPLVTAAVSGRTVTLSWTLEPSAEVAAMTIEVGSAPGLADLAVTSVDSAPGSLTVDAPPGVYFVRLRARGACGTGTASNELHVAVPKRARAGLSRGGPVPVPPLCPVENARSTWDGLVGHPGRVKHPSHLAPLPHPAPPKRTQLAPTRREPVPLVGLVSAVVTSYATKSCRPKQKYRARGKASVWCSSCNRPGCGRRRVRLCEGSSGGSEQAGQSPRARSGGVPSGLPGCGHEHPAVSDGNPG